MKTRDYRVLEVSLRLLVPVDVSMDKIRGRIEQALGAPATLMAKAWEVSGGTYRGNTVAVEGGEAGAAAIAAAMNWKNGDVAAIYKDGKESTPITLPVSAKETT